MTDEINTSQAASATELILEQARMYGATPGPDEFDTRPVWDQEHTIDAVTSAFQVIAENWSEPGHQIGDELEPFLWGIVNACHAQIGRLDRAVDNLSPEIRDLQMRQDGSEISARELELKTDKARALYDRRDAFEQMRDAVAEQYKNATGSMWRPRTGSHVSHTSKLTAASIDARDFMRARNERQTSAHIPDGTLVAVTGGKDYQDHAKIWATLDKVLKKHPDMVLIHGGAPGAERIAAQWAEARERPQIVFKPDWNAHKKAAPFRRNDKILDLLPAGVVAFPGSGISENLTDKAEQMGIPVMRVR